MEVRLEGEGGGRRLEGGVRGRGWREGARGRGWREGARLVVMAVASQGTCRARDRVS